MLLDDDGRQPLLAEQRAQCREQFLHDDRRQALGRLVEQQQARIGRERAADRQHLLLAAGQRAAGLLGALLRRGNSPKTRSMRPRARAAPRR